jgi:hypothetical protein
MASVRQIWQSEQAGTCVIKNAGISVRETGMKINHTN